MSEHAVAYFGSKCAVVGNVGKPLILTSNLHTRLRMMDVHGSIVIVMVAPGFRIEYIAIIIKSNTIALLQYL